MSKTTKTLCWALAIVLTLAVAAYQHAGSRTQAQKVEFTLNGTAYSVSLPHSLDTGSEGMKLHINDLPPEARICCLFEPCFGEAAAWDTLYARKNESGTFIIPFSTHHTTEKINYYISIASFGETVFVTDKPLTLHFKNSVPIWLLIPHLLLMLAALLFSSLSGILAFIKQASFYRYAKWALWYLLGGGLVLGSLVQKISFGHSWADWPLEQGFTNNKTLVIVLFWIAAVWMNRKLKKRYIWAVFAAVVMLAVYAIPHSITDYT